MKEKIPFLLALLGVLAIVGTYLYVFNPTYTKTQDLKSENGELDSRIAELEGMLEESGNVAAETERLELAVRQIYMQFPTNVIAEDAVMEGIEMEHASQVVNGQIEYRDSESAYTPIAETIDQMPEPEAESGDTEDEETEEATETAAVGSSLELIKQPVSYEFICDLTTFMRAAEYVCKTGERDVISGAKIVYDPSTGLLGGRIDLDKYYIVGLDKDYEPATFDRVPTGNLNLFSTLKPNPDITLEAVNDAVHNEEATED